MTKFSDFIRAPGTAGPPTQMGIRALGFAFRTDIPAAIEKYLWVGGAQSFTGGEKTQGRQNLGVVIGSDVQAFSASLASLAGLSTAADRLAYTTASNTWAVTPLTPFARTMLADASGAALRTTIGLGNVNNTSDADKPVSTATQAALNLKAPLTGAVLASPTLNTPSGEFLRALRRRGLVLSNNVTDATNDIDIAPGVASSDGATPVLMVLASAITKRTDAAWAEGAGNGGWLDGAFMPNGTGFAFLIRRSDTGVIDVGFSASLTPTLPTNYDQKTRIGSILRVGGAIVGFTQTANYFQINTPTLDINVANGLTTSRRLDAIKVPAGIKVFADVRVRAYDASATALILVQSPSEANAAPSNTAGPLLDGVSYIGSDAVFNKRILTDASGQIAARASIATVDFYQVVTLGWEDLTL